MTYKEQLMIDHPEFMDETEGGGCEGCPYHYGYETRESSKANCKENGGRGCDYCWTREKQEKKKPLTANEYQRLAARTINKDLDECQQTMHALHGMVGEVGELHSIYQKVYQGHLDDEIHKKKELSDLCWFIAEYCTAHEWELEEIMRLNIEKLMARYPEGFSEEKSLHRREGDI